MGEVERERGHSDRGRVARSVEVGRHLHVVGPHHPQPREPVQELAGLAGRRTPHHRRAGAGRRCRVEEVDVDRDVDRVVADRRPDLVDRVAQGPVEQRVGVHHGEPDAVGVGRAHADLDGAARIDEPVPDREPEHGPVVEVVTHVPGVAVRVEVDQRQRTVALGRGREHGVRHHVVATEREDHRVGGQDLGDGPAHLGHHAVGVARPEHGHRDVAPVDDPGRLPEVDRRALVGRLAPRPVAPRVLADEQRLLADRPGSEPGAGSVGGAPVERDPHHRDVGLREVAGRLAPGERDEPRVGRRRRAGRIGVVGGHRRQLPMRSIEPCM